MGKLILALLLFERACMGIDLDSIANKHQASRTEREAFCFELDSEIERLDPWGEARGYEYGFDYPVPMEGAVAPVLGSASPSEVLTGTPSQD